MNICLLGGGFTGLAASYRLLQKGHQVTLIEKDPQVGGLAGGFKDPNWRWTLEKGYHHWFTNDFSVLNLAKEINHKVIIKTPKTSVFVDGKTFRFDSPFSILTFPCLPIVDRIRLGYWALRLKLTSNPKQFEDQKAGPWISEHMGEKSYRLIWAPLLQAKFGEFKDDIALTWFWARIYKRTQSLAYPEGGFMEFTQNLEARIKNLGGKLILDAEITNITSDDAGIKVTFNKQGLSGRNQVLNFDKVISTLPSPILVKVAPQLPKSYTTRITSIPHLHAQNLILVLDKPFMKDNYWLNITDKSFPFLVLAEHTNFIDPSYYGNQHILYIGNYLVSDHPYLKLSAEELLIKFSPFLQKINPTYHSSLLTYYLFTAPFAQPVVTVGYKKLIPDFISPLDKLFIANMDMVYPWDRGTNYAVEMGEKIADIV